MREPVRFTVRLRVRWMGQRIGPWDEAGVRLALRRGFGEAGMLTKRPLIWGIRGLDTYYR
jgi:hypothetical protein